MKSEFENKKDIRDYLRKWQEQHDCSLDPVRGPGTSNPLVKPNSDQGNMLNDSREMYDASEERARHEDEDTSAFSTHMEEGNDVKHFLEPGDLVGLSS